MCILEEHELSRTPAVFGEINEKFKLSSFGVFDCQASKAAIDAVDQRGDVFRKGERLVTRAEYFKPLNGNKCPSKFSQSTKSFLEPGESEEHAEQG